MSKRIEPGDLCLVVRIEANHPLAKPLWSFTIGRVITARDLYINPISGVRCWTFDEAPFESECGWLVLFGYNETELQPLPKMGEHDDIEDRIASGVRKPEEVSA